MRISDFARGGKRISDWSILLDRPELREARGIRADFRTGDRFQMWKSVFVSRKNGFHKVELGFHKVELGFQIWPVAVSGVQ